MAVTIGGLPVYNALISDEETGMLKVSLVDDPAVMSNFQAFDNTRRMQMYSVQDDEKRLVRGVVMRADFPIYRRDGHGEYYIIYTADTIRRMAEKYLADGRQNEVNVMHDQDVSGVQMVQFFIKGDGVAVEGFPDIADGSLFAEYHIVSDEIWGQVKDGTYRGFSLEGVFDLVPNKDVAEVADIVDTLDGQFKEDKPISKANNNMSKIARFKEALAKLFAEAFANVTTDKGILSWDGDEDLKAGDNIFIEDADGNRTPAEDGDYMTADAKTIRVADGKVAEIIDPEAEVATEPEAEEEEMAMGRIATDNGELVWEGEEDLKEGDAVFVENEEGRAPAADGEYRTEDGKVIVVVEGKVSEIRDPEAEVAPEAEPAVDETEELRKENADLRAQVETLSKQVEELSRMPAAKPAHEEVTTSGPAVKTGNKGLDRLAELMRK